MRERAALYGGSVEAGSLPGGGYHVRARLAVDRVPALVVDDEELVRTGLRLVLDTEPDLTVVGTAADGAQAVREVARLRPDVVLMDIRMPLLDGLAPTGSCSAGPSRPPARSSS